jgi:GNAT superfamily N-acetyltransferase
MNYRRVSDANGESFRQALTIYRQSFPDNERHRDMVIAERVDAGFYQLWIGEDTAGVAMFALLHELTETGFFLLDYIALRRDARGGGAGSLFCSHLIERIFAGGKRLLLEVEDPEFGDNHGERVRRLNFYRKLGACELLGVPYKMPPLAGGAPTEMLLLLAPVDGTSSLAGALVRGLIVQIYEELYQRDARDELLLSILHEVPETILVAA